MEPGEGFEPPAYGLRGRSSTTELSGRSLMVARLFPLGINPCAVPLLDFKFPAA